MCPFVQKFSVVAEDSDYAAQETREAVWDRDPADADVSAETSGFG
jgi:hypothetical protein